MIDVGA